MGIFSLVLRGPRPLRPAPLSCVSLFACIRLRLGSLTTTSIPRRVSPLHSSLLNSHFHLRLREARPGGRAGFARHSGSLGKVVRNCVTGKNGTVRGLCGGTTATPRRGSLPAGLVTSTVKVAAADGGTSPDDVQLLLAKVRCRAGALREENHRLRGVGGGALRHSEAASANPCSEVPSQRVSSRAHSARSKNAPVASTRLCGATARCAGDPDLGSVFFRSQGTAARRKDSFHFHAEQHWQRPRGVVPPVGNHTFHAAYSQTAWASGRRCRGGQCSSIFGTLYSLERTLRFHSTC